MFNPPTEDIPIVADDVADLRGQLGGLANLARAADFILNAAAVAERLKQLDAATRAAIEAKQAAETEIASLTRAKAEQMAAFAKREEELNSFYRVGEAKNKAAAEREARVLGMFREMKTLDEQMRRAVIRFAQVPFDDRLQSVPDWQALERDLLGTDAHFAETSDGEFAAGPSVTTIEPVPNAQSAATVRRSRPRGAARRTEA